MCINLNLLEKKDNSEHMSTILTGVMVTEKGREVRKDVMIPMPKPNYK
ncbi:hypothetical protein EV203_107101 [Caldanaerobacter subterraneus]|uniref:Uncharacterized protein n=1 Tax=Caldanaerobacter subterraneus TaxID=911092 RepID=A0A4R2KBN5_9THEO|nr:hypothetical protein EV203_107101 [Caldanaerobacter subterraneus]